MPIDCRVDAERRWYICEAHGRLTSADFFAQDRELREDPRVTPDFDQLYDLSGISDFEVPTEDIRRLAEQRPYFSPASGRAFVGHGPLQYGMVRMYELYRADRAGEFRFFEDRAEAERWLMTRSRVRVTEE